MTKLNEKKKLKIEDLAPDSFMEEEKSDETKDKNEADLDSKDIDI